MTTWTDRFRQGIGFAFGELLGDIGPLLLLGIGIAGVIAGLIPDQLIENYLGEGIVPMLIMLVVGMPVFVCATSSTPIVAALAVKGLSPGAALVFLLAGPVTNAATITVLASLLGKRVTAVYVAVISTISLISGIAVNHLYGILGMETAHWATSAGEEGVHWFGGAMSVVLVGMILWRFWRDRRTKHDHSHPESDSAASPSCCN